MDDSAYHLLALLGAALFIAVTARSILSEALWLKPWQLAALFTVLFAGWTGYAISAAGLFGFWDEHRRGAWSVQIWLDLLFAAGVAWMLLLPRARAMGMRPWPWLTLIVCTGSIGLGAMIARCLYLEDLVRRAAPTERKAI